MSLNEHQNSSSGVRKADCSDLEILASMWKLGGTGSLEPACNKVLSMKKDKSIVVILGGVSELCSQFLI